MAWLGFILCATTKSETAKEGKIEGNGTAGKCSKWLIQLAAE